jgi:hypothetical protein
MDDRLIVDFSDPVSLTAAVRTLSRRVSEVKDRYQAALAALHDAEQQVEEADQEATRLAILHRTLLGELEAMGHSLPNAPAGSSAEDESIVDLEPPSDGADAGDDDTRAQILSVINSEAAAWTVADVSKRLPTIKRKTVGWYMWKLAEVEDIQKLDRGIYAPHSYKMQELEPVLANENGLRSSMREAV